MHLEVLVEDQSGKRMLDEILPRIVGPTHTFVVHSYKGIGRIPKGLKPKSDPAGRILLAELPRLLRGYGKTFASYPCEYHAAVVVVCDLDRKCLVSFRKELLGLVEQCHPRPDTRFCLAIEEGEAWLLGDLAAIRTAYPGAREAVLQGYSNDSVCGTWELLADAIYVGGSAVLIAEGWAVAGAAKFEWADKISPFLDIEQNASPSFRYFRDTLRGLTK
jgi:hypothetical protein